MAVTEPAVVYPEAEFQKAIVSLIEDVLGAENRRFALLQRFGLDVAVFLDAPPPTASAVRLLEVKAFGAQRMGGVGFGNGRGIGPQVDLLLSGENSLCLFDGTVRWAYADATLVPGTCRYGLLTCELAKKAAMGVVTRGKQNNLRISALRPCLIGWVEFCSQVKDFLVA
jgi:hypothetical protein